MKTVCFQPRFKNSAKTVKNSGRGGPQRSRMKHATSDRLVYLHESFHLMQRMQNAGWSADVERWESDCDSDDSEGEAEADLKELTV